MSRGRRYEILEGIPPYGPMYVSVTQDGKPYSQEGFVVRFFKSDGSNWVANFETGWTKLRSVVELDGNENILVVSDGLCYLMSPDSEKPFEVFGIDFTELLDLDSNRSALCGGTDLTILEPDGTYWRSERISWDGFKDLTADGHVVHGLSYDPTNEAKASVPFTYNTITKELKGGSYNRYPIVKKPWWKVW